jgi:negative regulator of flagellin synthesis FlgM
MVNPIGQLGQNRVRDAYVTRTDQAHALQRAEPDHVRREPRVEPAVIEDSVQISDGLRTLQRANELVRNAPDVRAERVAELRRQVETGTYSVSAVDLASKMINGSNGLS